MKSSARSRYAILVDGKEVWRGRNLKKKSGEVFRKYPGRDVGIAWIPGPGTQIYMPGA